MSEPIISLLEAFSEAAVLIDRGVAAAYSPLARHYLPQLQIGAPVPACLPQSTAPGGGVFTTEYSTYSYTNTILNEGQLVVFRPAPQTALTDVQLDGAVRQLRQFMGELFLQIPQESTPADAPLRKTLYRMFRLLDNLEYLHGPEESAPRSGLDFAGLCRQTVQEAAPLLSQGGVCLDYACPDSSLLIPGSPILLRRMLLELISNSVRTVGKGEIHLRLRSQGRRVLLSLSDSGAAPSQRQLASLLQQDSDQNIPAPGAGAGLGLSIVRRIVAAHRGTMLVEWGEGAPTSLISLPAGPVDPRASVNAPTVYQDGGLSPILVGLADVLPVSVFELAELD